MKKITISEIAILLLGIGIGIILTSTVFYYNPQVTYREYTEEEIEAKYKEIIVKNGIEDNKTKNNKTESKEQKEKDQSKKTELIEIVFVIKKGEPISEIADNLLEKNIINNKESFLDRLTVRGDTQKIQYGEFILQLPISNDELIDKLIKK